MPDDDDTRPQNEAQHPWTVLVEAGKIVGRYQAVDTHPVGCGPTRISLHGVKIQVYQLAATRGPPPPVGTYVDPIRLGWSN